MSEKRYLFKEESIVNIANEIRRISGDSKKLSIEEIYNFLKYFQKMENNTLVIDSNVKAKIPLYDSEIISTALILPTITITVSEGG